MSAAKNPVLWGLYLKFHFRYFFCGHLNHCDLSHFLAVVNLGSLSAE